VIRNLYALNVVRSSWVRKGEDERQALEGFLTLSLGRVKDFTYPWHCMVATGHCSSHILSWFQGLGLYNLYEARLSSFEVPSIMQTTYEKVGEKEICH
jgi:hypothetical protein